MQDLDPAGVAVVDAPLDAVAPSAETSPPVAPASVAVEPAGLAPSDNPEGDSPAPDPAPAPLTKEEKARLLAQFDPDDLKEHPEFQKHVRRAQARTRDEVRKEMAQAQEYSAQMLQADAAWRQAEQAGTLPEYLRSSQQNRDNYNAVLTWREQQSQVNQVSQTVAGAILSGVKTRVAGHEKLSALADQFDDLAAEHTDPADFLSALIEAGVEKRLKELEKWAESEAEARTTARLAARHADKGEPDLVHGTKGKVNAFQPKDLNEVYAAVGNKTISATEGNRLAREFNRLSMVR